MPDDPLSSVAEIDPALVEHVKSEDHWAFADGALSRKTKLLIAAAFDAAQGATHGARFLVEQAVEAGASKEEVGEALRVAYVMSGRGSVYVAAHAVKNLFQGVRESSLTGFFFIRRDGRSWRKSGALPSGAKTNRVSVSRRNLPAPLVTHPDPARSGWGIRTFSLPPTKSKVIPSSGGSSAMSSSYTHSSQLARGIQIEWLSAVWMVIEALVALFAGILAHSIALIAFGADSVIELVAGGALLFRLYVEANGGDAERVERAERAASWIVGIALLALAAYIVVSSAVSLFTQSHPEATTLGIGIAVASSILMPFLATAKKRIGRRIGSKALVSDGACSMVCAYMSWILLAGVAATPCWDGGGRIRSLPWGSSGSLCVKVLKQ